MFSKGFLYKVIKSRDSELNESTACECQRLAVARLIEDKMSKLKKGHNFEINVF